MSSLAFHCSGETNFHLGVSHISRRCDEMLLKKHGAKEREVIFSQPGRSIEMLIVVFVRLINRSFIRFVIGNTYQRK